MECRTITRHIYFRAERSDGLNPTGSFSPNFRADQMTAPFDIPEKITRTIARAKTAAAMRANIKGLLEIHWLTFAPICSRLCNSLSRGGENTKLKLPKLIPPTPPIKKPNAHSHGLRM